MSHFDREAALLFPGQGAQLPGMGRGFLAGSSVAHLVFEEAGDVLGWSVAALCLNGTSRELRSTRKAQPALLTVSVAALRVLESDLALMPQACLGHSLGEYSALVAAGALSFADALRCVRLRGEFMEEALPQNAGGMAAVLGLRSEEVSHICRRIGGDSVLVVANLNAPGQVVVSGHQDALARSASWFKEAGARRVVPLRVSSAFHSPLMRPVAERLAEALSGVPLAAPRCPVLSNVTGRPHEDPESIRRLLVEQVLSPVLWEDCVRWVLGRGIRDFFEFGPGGVLAGLNRAIDRSANTVVVDEPAALARLQVA